MSNKGTVSQDRFRGRTRSKRRPTCGVRSVGHAIRANVNAGTALGADVAGNAKHRAGQSTRGRRSCSTRTSKARAITGVRRFHCRSRRMIGCDTAGSPHTCKRRSDAAGRMSTVSEDYRIQGEQDSHHSGCSCFACITVSFSGRQSAHTHTHGRNERRLLSKHVRGKKGKPNGVNRGTSDVRSFVDALCAEVDVVAALRVAVVAHAVAALGAVAALMGDRIAGEA
jgi:hypothetical protein